MFPALRLIQERRSQNVRRLRLRHIWLLLLRIAVIALLVLAIARPSLPAADYFPNMRELLTLLVIVTILLATYWSVIYLWRRKRLPNHSFAYRRTLLRGGVGVIGLILCLLLLAWPYQHRIAAEISAPLPNISERVPVAGVFLFDTSLSMHYRKESKTRLDIAKEIALKHLDTLPPRSRISVSDSTFSTVVLQDNKDIKGHISTILFLTDLATARDRIESIEIHPVTHPLNEQLRAALDQQKRDRDQKLQLQTSVPDDQRPNDYSREIYLFTDLARSAWKLGTSKFLRDELKRLPWVNVYIIDVGVIEPMNVGISNLQLSQQTLPTGGTLSLETTVTATGIKNTNRTVELYVRNEAGTLIKRGMESAQIDSQTAARVPFTVKGLTGPVTHGELRLVSSDPLPADDVLFFTVEFRPPPEIFVVAPTKAQARYLQQALAPNELVRLGRARYHCTYGRPSNLANTDLSRYDVVCLVSIANLHETTWETLVDYVEAGGGLAVFLGTYGAKTAVSYNSDVAQSIMPAELLASLPFAPPEYLYLRNLSHPILYRLGKYEGAAAELGSADIRRYWKVMPQNGGSVIAAYTNRLKSPAVLQRSFGQGHTLLLTTSIDLKGWSDLPRTWPFLILADQTMHYLARRTESNFNYEAGDNIIVRIESEWSARRYLLRKPNFQQLQREASANATSLIIYDADQIGNYELVDADKNPKFVRGFSVNAPAGESDFAQLTDQELNNLLGEKRYSKARTTEDLERFVVQGRLGMEMFPIVVVFVLVVFCTEHLVANYFYQDEQAAKFP